MGYDALKGRFVVVRDDKVRPMEIIMDGNSFCYYGSAYTNCRDFFSPLDNCVKSDFVTRETAIKCITDQYDRLKGSRGEISDVYKGFPKTASGFVNGFFKKAISEEDFKKWEDSPYQFEKLKMRALNPL